MDDTGPQSLIVVVHYGIRSPYFSSVLLLEKNENKRIFPPEKNENNRERRRPKLKRSFSLSSIPLVTPLYENLTLDEHPNPNITKITWSPPTYSLDAQKDFVAHLTQPPLYQALLRWNFCAISAEELCIVVDPGWLLHQIDDPVKGFVLNLSTTNLKSIHPPLGTGKGFRFYKHVVALGGRIYFLTYSYSGKGSLFKRYNPLDESWDNLEPFPDDYRPGHRIRGILLGTVAFDDTIVLNMVDILWAYNVLTDKWYVVDVPDRQCYEMFGNAVVLGNTIYALADTSPGIVIALSIKKEGTNVDLKYQCSLLSEIEVLGMKEDYFKYKGSGWSTRKLVHLGEDRFCLVHCCHLCVPHVDCQPIQVTYIKLEKRDSMTVMTVTDKFIFNVKIRENEQFHFECCFSLPNHKAAALGKGSLFHANPFYEDDLSEEKDKNQEAEVPDL